MNHSDRMPFIRRLSFFAQHVAATAFFFLFIELLHASDYLRESIFSKSLWLLLWDETQIIGSISAGYLLLLTLISFRMKRHQRSGWLLGALTPPLLFIALVSVYVIYESHGISDGYLWSPFICGALIVIYFFFMSRFYEKNSASLTEKINSINNPAA